MTLTLEQMLEGIAPLSKVTDRALKSVDLTTTGVIEVLGWFGDAKLRWDRNNAEEVGAARQTFDRLTGKGFTAFRSDPTTGEAGERLAQFDAAAQGLILVPPIAGGA